jgi:hypothetical protein
MAISAVSSVGRDYVQPFRLPQAGASESPRGAPLGGVDRVRAVPSLAGREDAAGPERELDAAGEKGGAEVEARALVPDPRRPEAIIADLLGEKSALERRQAEERGARSAEVLSVISQLKARDGEVRAHEAAHIAAGGRYITGGASYSYQQGPDGVQYAVGGEVGIDSSPAPGKPEETVQKMRIVRAAALAPSEPSGADLSVAAAAAQAEAAAVAEIAQRGAEEAAKGYAKEASRASDPAARGRDGETRPAALDVVA